MQNKKSPSVLGLVFLTVFIDLIGFSIIFPIFPQLLEHYVQLEGADSLIGKLQSFLVELTGSREGADFAVVTLFGGILGSIYSLLQFLFAPFWGHISDRNGRRSALMLTLAGTAISYVLWFFSGSFMILVGARILGGIMAGNISIASAAVSDTTSGADRAKGMGIVGMAIGLGFVVGPAIGGLSASWNVLEVWPEGEQYGVNPFSGPALIAFCLAALNCLWAIRKFPETLPPERRGVNPHTRTLMPFRALRDMKYPGVRRTNFISFLYLAAFSGMEFTLTFLAAERFDFGPHDNMWMFVFVGLMIALVQGGIVRRLVPRVGERKVASYGLAALVPGFCLVGFAPNVAILYLGLGFMATGSALAMPCFSALVSRYSPDQVQGLVMGSFRSVGALARAVGPLFGGVLYWLLGSQAPYAAGALVILVPLFMTLKLPDVPESEPGAQAA
ncbi:MAG: MFS family permease [Candidatus Paceibacteria bacterium]